VSGWVPMDADAWPVVANALPRPWPREAILYDLRWWADRVRMGRARRPGRPALRERWGVSDWAAKQLLKAEAEWADPSKPPANRQPTASRPPANRQPTASGDKVKGEQSARSRQPTASRPPADHQLTTSEPPHARSVHRTPTPTPTPPEGGATAPLSLVQPAAEPSTPAKPDRALEVLQGWPSRSGRTLTGSAHRQALKRVKSKWGLSWAQMHGIGQMIALALPHVDGDRPPWEWRKVLPSWAVPFAVLVGSEQDARRRWRWESNRKAWTPRELCRSASPRPGIEAGSPMRGPIAADGVYQFEARPDAHCKPAQPAHQPRRGSTPL
jgi:hypothetical protein